MDITTAMAIRDARSMEVFADGEPTVQFGAWRCWKEACSQEGRTIPPAEFKALSKEEQEAYLPAYIRKWAAEKK